jgi:hypothetical protein
MMSIPDLTVPQKNVDPAILKVIGENNLDGSNGNDLTCILFSIVLTGAILW